MVNGNLAYRDERRTELIDGEIVAMSPSPAWIHVSAAGNIYHLFRNYLRGKKCMAIPDGFDLHLTEKDVFVPDMMVVCDPDKIKPNGVYGPPDLVVEVLSPSTTKRDRTYKKEAYERCGVPEYWLVSPPAKSIEVYWLDEEGKYTLREICALPADWEREQMTDAEKDAVVTEFKCRLYDDLIIRLEDIFNDT